MRHALVAALALLAFAAPPVALAETPGTESRPVASVTSAHAEDTASPEAILDALYAVISGDAGVPRDWDRFRNLFHPSGRLMPVGGPAEGPAVATVMTPDDYIARAEPFLMRGFHERQILGPIDRFGHVAHVFSTYESRRTASDAEPFARGINSIQLFDDGTRWWIISVYWQSETPQIQIPRQYLPAS